MAGRTITRSDLAEAVYQRVGLSRVESGKLVELVLDTICDVLVSGEDVKLSRFGTFLVKKKGYRMGRNPKSGVEIPIAPRRVLTFKASINLKDRVNGAKVKAED